MTIQPISVRQILRSNQQAVAINVLLTIVEITLTALIPLFIGFTIDGLLAGQSRELLILMAILVVLVIVSVTRRFYDTRAYGKIRVTTQVGIAKQNHHLPVSTLNARLEMGRELVDFLEHKLPEILTASVQFVISLAVLFFLNPILSATAFIAAVSMMLIYGFFHQGFYQLNGAHNQQTEQQVSLLAAKSLPTITRHFNSLKALEIKLSDREALLYGCVFIVLLAMVVSNLWYATSQMAITAGTIFSIVSYSWEFVEAAIVLPVTLQSWARLSEITKRINSINKED
ncbi:ABC transporter six-transmembrane domain-containing protein [Thalassotalea euphylliae]|uniref:ABC transmembrane type-1 domain-containing protein n=1 Tax=Thalassotalea euphylliae TaxID=1655234 RepID=A0A3E0U1L2_9GAMM|nr:ABC transporter six-transmembrane domain-containing protein [Thalassotalea euphylliae]REL30105.1 hypothetical protein DXX94_04980 [Thalassotalea euphylliae]